MIADPAPFWAEPNGPVSLKYVESGGQGPGRLSDQRPVNKWTFDPVVSGPVPELLTSQRRTGPAQSAGQPKGVPMKRRTFDVIASSIGLGLAALLIVAGGLLTWASSFVHDQVHNQLAEQQIYFPKADDESIAAPEFKAMHQYAGQQLVTGAQAEVYADHYILNHLKEMPYQGVYSKLSAASRANPDNTDLADAVGTSFKGTTLRGMLLNAYAWDKTGTIAGDAALVAWIGAGVMALLGGLGLWHSRRVPDSSEILTGKHEELDPSKA
jgi:hypothetical protein